jgi:hypothetical protein
VFLLIAGAFAFGETAVTSGEQVQHQAVADFKASMLEAYADQAGNWRWFSESRARDSLEEATRLDPDNLDAFSIAQKLLIKDQRFAEAKNNIAARRARCRSKEWLCENVCDYLGGMIRLRQGASVSGQN